MVKKKNLFILEVPEILTHVANPSGRPKKKNHWLGFADNGTTIHQILHKYKILPILNDDCPNKSALTSRTLRCYEVGLQWL